MADGNDPIMEQLISIHPPVIVQHLTPESSSRVSLGFTLGDDSGYDSLPSSSFSSSPFSHKEGSVTPTDTKKRLFTSNKYIYTPELSTPTARVVGRARRYISSPMLIKGKENCNSLTENLNKGENESSSDDEICWHGFHTPTKHRPETSSKFSVTPPKSHPYYVRDSSGNLCKTLKESILMVKSRTPPRNKTFKPLLKLPSFSELSNFHRGHPRNGLGSVDFLWCLGKERIMMPALSLILSYLSPEDLISCCLVSNTWRMLIVNDKLANSRRLEAVKNFKRKKENISWGTLKSKGGEKNLKKIRVPQKLLNSIENTRLTVPNEILPTPPPKMSPRKIRFELFRKEGLRLENAGHQHLQPCPRCSHPSHVDMQLSLGVCTRLSCQFRFCILCHCCEHKVPVNISLTSPSSSPPRFITCPFSNNPKTPPSPNQNPIYSSEPLANLIGSKRSKRNLRRLLD